MVFDVEGYKKGNIPLQRRAKLLIQCVMARNRFLEVFKTDAASGAVLAVAAITALVMANTTLSDAYYSVLYHRFPVQLGSYSVDMTLAKWIKDGLMAVFFWVVGLEIKREIVSGELSSFKKMALPAFGALGGMVVPAAIYLLYNGRMGGVAEGWPIPVATDIAFAVAAFAIVARQAPTSLKVFLLSLAIVDDLGAVILIAALFTENINYSALFGAFFVLAALALIGWYRKAQNWVYFVGFMLVWAFTHESGVHSSVAGVAVALTVPSRPRGPGLDSALNEIEHALRPWSALVIMPLFALSAAGLSLQGLTTEQLVSPVTMGVILGLVVGKPIGVFGFAFVAVLLGLASKPKGSTWAQILGVAWLCGIGFTMSLFLGGLALSEVADFNAAKLGVLIGSLLSAVLGVTFLGLHRIKP